MCEQVDSGQLRFILKTHFRSQLLQETCLNFLHAGCVKWAWFHRRLWASGGHRPWTQPRRVLCNSLFISASPSTWVLNICLVIELANERECERNLSNSEYLLERVLILLNWSGRQLSRVFLFYIFFLSGAHLALLSTILDIGTGVLDTQKSSSGPRAMATMLSLQGVFGQRSGLCQCFFVAPSEVAIPAFFWLCGKLIKIVIHLPVIRSFFLSSRYTFSQ